MHRSIAVALLVLVTACRIGYEAVDRDGGDDPVDATVDAPDAAIDTPDLARVCPTGLVELAPGATTCIDKDERGTAEQVAAVAACAGAGLALCTEAEWHTACTQSSEVKEMFNDQGGSALDWEWVADLPEPGVARKRGWASCEDTSQHTTSANNRYRCCGAKIPAS